MITFILYFFGLVLVTCRFDSEHASHQFKPGGNIYQLDNEDFTNMTKIGQQMDKPWFIMFYAHWCDHCIKQFPFWQSVADKYSKSINFGAVECHENEDLRDRFDIPLFPSYMYFTTDGKIHKFIGYRTLQNISEWIEQEKWRNNTAHFEEIPERIQTKNYFKRFMRRLFHLYTMIGILVLFVLLIIAFCIYDKKHEDQRLTEARRIKQELIRKKNEKELQDFQARIQKID